MLNKKFLTRLLNDGYRKSVLLKNSKIVNDQRLKLKAYATYIVDKHANERDEDCRDIKQAGYGFCPFDVLMWVSTDGSVKKTVFEFNTVNHFLVKNDKAHAVEVAECMLSELVRENRRDIACFDIDKIEAESKRAQEDYETMKVEVKKLVEEELKKRNEIFHESENTDERQ